MGPPRLRLLLILLLMLAASPPARSEPPTEKKPAARTDRYGDPLPEGVLARMGTGRLRHAGLFIVDALAFSPDGKSLLSGDRDRGLCIWEVASGKRIRRFEGPTGWPFAAAFSADGTTVVCVGGGNAPKLIAQSRVLDVASGKALKSFELRDATGAYEADVSPNGKLIAMGRIDGAVQTVRLYDPATGNEKARIPVHGQVPRQITFRADAKTIAIADLSDIVRVHDTATGKEVAALKRKGAVFWPTVLSPDGRWAASISVDYDGNEPSVISVWDVGNGKERHQIKGLHYGHSAAFSPDSKLLATGGQNEFVLWDVATGRELHRRRIWHPAVRLAFSPDGKIIAVAVAQGGITLWDVATGRLLAASADPPIAPHALRFTEGGKQLLGAAGVLRAWDAATGRELRRYPEVSHFAWQYVPVLSPDGRLLAAPDNDGTVHLCDARTGTQMHALKGHDKWVTAYLFAPDGKLITAGVDKTIRIWDVASGKELHNLDGHGVLAQRLVVSPNSRWLAAVNARGLDYDIHVWDLVAARETKRIAAGLGWASPFAFSPDSRFLAAVGGRYGESGMGGAAIWDVTSGIEWRKVQGHKEATWCLAFSPDGRILATGGSRDDHTVRLWELASGRERRRFDGHDCIIYSVAFSPDGRLLAASSPDAPVYVWDVTGSLEQPVKQLSKANLERAWADLASDDAAKAFQAMRSLLSSPTDAVPSLKNRLQPAAAPERRRLAQLVTDLDDKQFAVREKAAEELEKLGELAAPVLRKAHERNSSAEVQRRVQQLLTKLDGPIAQPNTMRGVRSVEVLEYIGTPEAQDVLKKLATGAPAARLTQEAKASLDRLAKRTTTP